jgi:hypothetical protein
MIDLDAHRTGKPTADRVLLLPETDEQRAAEGLTLTH